MHCCCIVVVEIEGSGSVYCATYHVDVQLVAQLWSIRLGHGRLWNYYVIPPVSLAHAGKDDVRQLSFLYHHIILL